MLWEKEAFNKKSDLMRGSLSLYLKKCMVKAFVWSVALYVRTGLDGVNEDGN